ncbi:MAG: hypothetical protein RIC38_13280, partial [Chromatocurvus sp.]
MGQRKVAPLLTVAGYLRPYRGRVAGAGAALLLTAGATLSLGRGIQILIDRGHRSVRCIVGVCC